MNPEFWWYLARASGIVAWLLLSASVVWGLLLTTRLLKRRVAPKWLLDLHRHLGGLAVAFTGLHLGALLADSYIEFSIADFLIPFASDWRPLPVALGVVAFYLLLVIEITSLAMKRLPRRTWRAIHLTSYLLFWVATLHGITAGTDAFSPTYWAATTLTTGIVVFLTLYRILAERTVRRVMPDPANRPPPAMAGSNAELP